MQAIFGRNVDIRRVSLIPVENAGSADYNATIARYAEAGGTMGDTAGGRNRNNLIEAAAGRWS